MQRAFEETFFVAPVHVPLDSLSAHREQTQEQRSQEHAALQLVPVPALSHGPGAQPQQQAKPHTRQVKHSLGYYKADVKKEIAGRHKRECHER